MSFEFILAHSFTENQIVSNKVRFTSSYVVKIEIISIGTRKIFTLICVNDYNKINCANKPIKPNIDKTTLNDLAEFQILLAI